MWTDLGAVKPKAVVEPATQLHAAAQWLGRFGRGMSPPREDDSHTSFVWSSARQAFVTDAATANGKAVQLGLRAASLMLLLFEDGEIADALSLHGKTDLDAESWVRGALQKRGFGLSGFDANAPYAMPDTKISRGGKYDALKFAGELAEISRAYDNVQPILDAVRARDADVTPGPDRVRSWPHHFDTGLFITLEEAPFETARGVGAGLAVPDKAYQEFYFYTYPWPRHPRDGMAKLKSRGRYQTEGFYGAVLPVSTLIKQKNQKAAVETFFEETVPIWKSLLEREIAAERRS
ncbi:MAG: hypothetical protein AAFV51_12010 [Pseudomonadota bacterium]